MAKVGYVEIAVDVISSTAYATPLVEIVGALARMENKFDTLREHKKPCPVCGRTLYMMRVVIAEDMAVKASEHDFKSGFNGPWAMHAIVGREFVHADNQYCSERIAKWVRLDEPELKILRPARIVQAATNLTRDE